MSPATTNNQVLPCLFAERTCSRVWQSRTLLLWAEECSKREVSQRQIQTDCPPTRSSSSLAFSKLRRCSSAIERALPFLPWSEPSRLLLLRVWAMSSGARLVLNVRNPKVEPHRAIFLNDMAEWCKNSLPNIGLAHSRCSIRQNIELQTRSEGRCGGLQAINLHRPGTCLGIHLGAFHWRWPAFK